MVGSGVVVVDVVVVVVVVVVGVVGGSVTRETAQWVHVHIIYTTLQQK